MLKDFARKIGYDDPLEIYLSRLELSLSSDYRISKRAISLLLLEEDKEILGLVRDKEKEGIDAIGARYYVSAVLAQNSFES